MEWQDPPLNGKFQQFYLTLPLFGSNRTNVYIHSTIWPSSGEIVYGRVDLVNWNFRWLEVCLYVCMFVCLYVAKYIPPTHIVLQNGPVEMVLVTRSHFLGEFVILIP